ncbi:MAG: hypothetical protein HY261_04295 [Chloroflexi bacterium]|nr:hypothetical protein [Chloroflexota bacterium]
MRKHRSLTGYIVEAVEEKLARDREEELRLGFASLAGTADDDSAAWIGAQRGSMGEVDA